MVTLCRGEDIWEIWKKKLCNRMQRTTGQPDVIRNHIFRCIAIELCIQDAVNTAILSVDLAESSHSCNDGNITLSDVIADDTGANGGPDGDGGGIPQLLIFTSIMVAIRRAMKRTKR